VLWPGERAGCIKHLLQLLEHDASQVAVQHLWGRQGSPVVMMFLVVPTREFFRTVRVLD
jgi:hypothetical protein